MSETNFVRFSKNEIMNLYELPSFFPPSNLVYLIVFMVRDALHKPEKVTNVQTDDNYWQALFFLMQSI